MPVGAAKAGDAAGITVAGLAKGGAGLAGVGSLVVVLACIGAVIKTLVKRSVVEEVGLVAIEIRKVRIRIPEIEAGLWG